MLPFDIAEILPDESFSLGSLKIPKYGSLTPSEVNKLRAIDDSLPYVDYIAAYCKIIIESRVKDIKEDLDDLSNVPIHLLEELQKFVINESNRWIKASEAEEAVEGEKKEDLIESSLNSDSNTPT